MVQDDNKRAVGATANDAPIIVLFTAAFDDYNVLDFRKAYQIGDVQCKGMGVMDWDSVDLLPSYREDESVTLEDVYRRIYR